MNLERAYRLSSILLTAVGFLALILTRELPVGLIVFGTAAVIVSALGVIRPGAWVTRLCRLSPGAWNILLVAALVAFVLDLLLLSRDVLPAAVHFLVVLMINKLLNLHQKKDFLHLYAISLLGVLAAAALTRDIWYGGVFFAYLFVAIWALLLNHLRNELDEHPGDLVSQDARTAWQPLTRNFFWTVNGIAVGAFCLTLAVFVVIPRVGAGFFEKNRTTLIRTSGFSERVDLGDIGAVKLDPTVVMRVEFPDQRGPVAERMPLYFRGMAYDRYDGRTWANSFARQLMLDHSVDGSFKPLPAKKATRRDSPALRQEILIEALDTAVLFGASFIRSVRGNFPMVLADGMGGFSMSYPLSIRFQYTALSIPDELDPSDRTSVSPVYPALIAAHFLQVPALSPRVEELARAVTRDGSTAYEKARMLERYLRKTYRYSLDVGTAVSENPLEDFLFTRQTGFCEHYATAMVVMLRTLGIPARLATGFLPGEWNDFGNYYAVRQQDAHAWVEVFWPASGWITFDPTPGIMAPPANRLWAKIGRAVDSVRLRWDRYVIRYNFRDQVAAVQTIRDRGDRIRDQASGYLGLVARWMTGLRETARQLITDHAGGVASVMAAAVALGLLWMAAQMRHPRRRCRDLLLPRQAAAAKCYARMLRHLEAQGISKPAGTTPYEFANRVRTEWQDVSSYVGPLTELYCRIRFGLDPWGPEDSQKADDLLDAIRLSRRQPLNPRP